MGAPNVLVIYLDDVGLRHPGIELLQPVPDTAK
jgi:hypothetical protein